MTLDKVYSLKDAFDDALAATGNGSTPDVVRHLQLHWRKVLDENQQTIEISGLGHLLRGYRKRHEPANKTGSTQLCLDLGIPNLEFDQQISVPLEDDPRGQCAWPDLDDATIDDIDKHIFYLETLVADTQSKINNYRILRQAAARIVPGRTNIPLSKLRQINRKRNN